MQGRRFSRLGATWEGLASRRGTLTALGLGVVGSVLGLAEAEPATAGKKTKQCRRETDNCNKMVFHTCPGTGGCGRVTKVSGGCACIGPACGDPCTQSSDCPVGDICVSIPGCCALTKGPVCATPCLQMAGAKGATTPGFWQK